ncbi:MAG: thioesterase family protein [Alphaproteobacteria bacterium]
MSYHEFDELLGMMTQEGETHKVTLPEDWLQGRTAFGGLSAALCYEAAVRAGDDLPPLRSAQFAFIGPAAGELTMTPTLLRRGKSAAYFGVDQIGEKGMATRAMLCFGAERPSAVDHTDIPAPQVPKAEECRSLWPPMTPEEEAEAAKRPKSFGQHFEQLYAGGTRPFGDGKDPMIQLWIRHKDDVTASSMVRLVALADAMPAASFLLFPERAPFSTMTWAIDVLTDDITCKSGWWLAESRAEATTHGYSAQKMTMWNDEGKPVLAMRQTVAIFI